MEGTPFVLVIGKKELAAGSALVKSRVRMEKTLVKFDELKKYMEEAREAYSNYLYDKSREIVENSIVEASDLESVKEAVLYNKKLVLAP